MCHKCRKHHVVMDRSCMTACRKAKAYPRPSMQSFLSAKSISWRFLQIPTHSEFIVQVITKGYIKSVRLNDKVTSGREQWLQWHEEFADKASSYREVSITRSFDIALYASIAQADLLTTHWSKSLAIFSPMCYLQMGMRFSKATVPCRRTGGC